MHNGGEMLRERQREVVVRQAALRYAIRAATAQDLPLLEWFGQYRDLRLVDVAAWAHVQAGTLLFFVAEVAGFPIGQIKVALVHDEDAKADGVRSGYLYALRVLGPFQRLGIGSALIAQAERALRERGFRWATITVERTNRDARRLYERLGYREVRRQRRTWSYQDPDGRTHDVDVDEMLMRKELAR